MQRVLIVRLFLTTIAAAVAADRWSVSIEKPVQNFGFNASAVVLLLRQLNCLHLHLRSSADTENSLVAHLLQQTECPLQLSSGNWLLHSESPSACVPHRAVVLSSRDLSVVLQQHASRAGILFCVLLDELPEQALLQAATQLWQRVGAYKVYYFTPTRSVFYNPFTRVAEHHGALVPLGTLSRCEDVVKNLNEYPLRVYIFNSAYSVAYGDSDTKTVSHVSGADAKVAKLLSEKLNFSMQLQWPDDEYFGTRLANGSFDGAIGRMIRYETDVTLTGFFVKDYLTKDVEFSVSVYMDDLCCYVHKADRVPQSILPLFAVNLSIWVSFLLTGTFCSLMWMSVRCMNLHVLPRSAMGTYQLPSDRLTLQYLRILTDSWVVWVRVNLVHLPPFSSERIFVISFSLVSVIFGALFESSLATVYIRPLYYPDINTMQQLDKSNFKIYIKHGAMKDDLFYGHSSPVYQSLNRKLVLVAELEDRLISMMSKRGGFTAVTRSSTLVLKDIFYFITNRIHKIPECPKSYHIAFLFPSKSPYQRIFNEFLLKFIEAGLIDQWIEEMKHKAKVTIQKHPGYVKEFGDIWKILSLSDLQLAFYALALGCSLATATFVAELLVRLYLTERLKRKRELKCKLQLYK